jgi:hypothetical protein
MRWIQIQTHDVPHLVDQQRIVGQLKCFTSMEEAFCCPDFRVTTWALCIDPPFAKLIRVSWFAKVVVMSERSTEQICELLDSLFRVDSGRILATLIRGPVTALATDVFLADTTRFADGKAV